MIIDFHTHCFADSIAKSAVTQLENGANIKAFSDGTTAGLLTRMESIGIDISVVMPVATKPSQVNTINDWAKQQRSQNLRFFGALHPDDENIFEVIKKLKKDGFKGVKFHPDYQRFFADEERMMPIYDALANEGLIVMLHAGVDIGLPGAVRCTPLMISKVLKQMPSLNLIAAHMGSHALWRDVEEFLIGENLYIDTSYSSYDLGIGGMTRMISAHGSERVLFGSDSPWTDAEKEIRLINDLPLSQSEKENILYKNAFNLLK